LADEMKIDAIDHIYRNGRHYDCLFGEPYMPFWLDLVRQVGAPVLELGCGTGKITIPIVEAGFEAIGVDLSEGMLAEARRKTHGRSLPIQFHQEDMTSFALDRKFPLIILPSNNLSHLLTFQEAEACFSRVADHLEDSGAFVIDAFVPSLRLLTNDPDEEDILSEYDDPEGEGHVTVAVKSVYEQDTQIRRNTTYQRNDGNPEIVGHLNMRMYFPQELEAILHYNGFEIVAKFGSYGRDPFSTHSSKQIIIAKHTQRATMA
jgi:SAM-dependent methyltransferase